jgi:hypothetical protein
VLCRRGRCARLRIIRPGVVVPVRL